MKILDDKRGWLCRPLEWTIYRHGLWSVFPEEEARYQYQQVEEKSADQDDKKHHHEAAWEKEPEIVTGKLGSYIEG